MNQFALKDGIIGRRVDVNGRFGEIIAVYVDTTSRSRIIAAVLLDAEPGANGKQMVWQRDLSDMAFVPSAKRQYTLSTAVAESSKPTYQEAETNGQWYYLDGFGRNDDASRRRNVYYEVRVYPYQDNKRLTFVWMQDQRDKGPWFGGYGALTFGDSVKILDVEWLAKLGESPEYKPGFIFTHHPERIKL